eukprot:GHVH01003638.1.p1 GENE.GHVH01003638.1~~GHVH01003638.1.p1  ORF type:complete len:637 (+),score=101.01 GHVH01003638.1:135-2045(+)
MTLGYSWNQANATQAEAPQVSALRPNLPAALITSDIAKEKDNFGDELDKLATQLDSFNWSSDVFHSIKVKLMNIADPMAIKQGCYEMKQMLSASRDDIFNIAQSSLDEGLVPPLMDIMQNETLTNDDRLSAAFCITNVLAGNEEQTSRVVNMGVILPLISLMASIDHRLRRQAMFAIANVAGNTDHDRMMLAEIPAYWQNTIEAIKKASQKKIEELGCWNLRNTSVLGGPSVAMTKPAIAFFLQFLSDEIAKEDYGAGYSSLRFAMETLATAAKTPLGRDLLISSFTEGQTLRPSVPTLCVIAARFTTDTHTRAFCLECAWKILEFDADAQYNEFLADIVNDMVSRQMISLLTAILKRVTTYSNVNRMYASRILLLILLRGRPNVSAVAASKMILPSFRADERSLPPISDSGYYIAGGPKAWFPPEEQELVPSEDTVTGHDLSLLRNLRFIHSEIDESSTLETVFRIIYNLDDQQEHWTREAAGRTFVAIILSAPSNFLQLLFHTSVVSCILDVMEMAHTTETWAKEQCVLKRVGWIDAGDYGDLVVPVDAVEKSKEEREFESLSSIRQLTTPSGSELAIKAIFHMRKSLPDAVRAQLWHMVIVNSNLNVLPRIRTVLFQSEEYHTNIDMFKQAVL